MTNATLSARLRDETKDVHTVAERAGIMPSLFKGTLPVAVYAELLANLRALYAALESALAASASPIAVRYARSELARTAALDEDLATFAAMGVRTTGSLRPAIREHVSRIEALRDSNLLAAHAYVRYLGDLSGGQILGRLVGKALNLPEGTGTAFYRFPRIADADAFKNELRAAMDSAQLTDAERDAFVAEARLAFGLSGRLFEELVPAASPV